MYLLGSGATYAAWDILTDASLSPAVTVILQLRSSPVLTAAVTVTVLLDWETVIQSHF